MLFFFPYRSLSLSLSLCAFVCVCVRVSHTHLRHLLVVHQTDSRLGLGDHHVFDGQGLGHAPVVQRELYSFIDCIVHGSDSPSDMT